MTVSIMQPLGELATVKIKGTPKSKLTLRNIIYWSAPHPGLSAEVAKWRMKNWPRFLNQLWRLQTMISAGKISHYPFMYGKLWLTQVKGMSGRQVNYGLVSLLVVTTVGVNDIVDEFDEATDDQSLKVLNYHGLGTGTTGPVIGDTTLETELTTEYTGDVRATGVQSQPSANIYRTLATNTLDSGTPAVTEHGILAQAATGGGLLLDRSTFSAINLDGTVGDALQSTYDLTIAAGS